MDVEFPLEMLRPIRAELFPAPQIAGVGEVSCEVHFVEFTLPNPNVDEASKDYEPLLFDSPLCLNFIHLPGTDLSQLAGRTFNFPMNPEPGYIDGSIYFVHTHNPVDVTRMVFGQLCGGVLPVQIESIWQMEFEASGFRDFACTIDTVIRESGTAEAKPTRDHV